MLSSWSKSVQLWVKYLPVLPHCAISYTIFFCEGTTTRCSAPNPTRVRREVPFSTPPSLLPSLPPIGTQLTSSQLDPVDSISFWMSINGLDPSCYTYFSQFWIYVLFFGMHTESESIFSPFNFKTWREFICHEIYCRCFFIETAHPNGPNICARMIWNFVQNSWIYLIGTYLISDFGTSFGNTIFISFLAISVFV